MNNSKAIFAPVKVGKNHLKHRVVLAPLTRFRATDKAVPTDLQVEYYKQRATEGGLLITEATFIHRLAGAYPHAPGIYNSEQVKFWQQVTQAVHSKGSIIYLQLWHLGRAGSKVNNPNGEHVVAPSPIPITGKTMTGGEYEVPRGLSVEEIKEIQGWYRQAALNAMEAGFDGVEIHSANGYLLDQFINSNSNQRTDEYGGSVENRARFALEVLDTVVDAVGAERTAIRFSPGETFQDMYDENVVETWSYLTSEIQNKHSDLSYLHMVQARAAVHYDHAPGTSTIPPDTLGPYRQIWKGPFISASGFSNAIEYAIELAERTGDLIAFGRVFIANPDLPERLRNGYPVNNYNRDTFYRQDAIGYTDYPFYEEMANKI